MRKTLKNTKGITLIALVVTIVVLLILAGVSINALFGQWCTESEEDTGEEQQQRKKNKNIDKLEQNLL